MCADALHATCPSTFGRSTLLQLQLGGSHVNWLANLRPLCTYSPMLGRAAKTTRALSTSSFRASSQMGSTSTTRSTA